MPDLVRECVVADGASVMHHCERLARIGAHPRSKSAPLGIIDNENCYVGAIGIAQIVNFIEIAVAFIGQPPNMVEMRAFLHVIHLVRVHELQFDVP